MQLNRMASLYYGLRFDQLWKDKHFYIWLNIDKKLISVNEK